MQSIEFYSDYRAYLTDFYEDRKKATASYSYRVFCQKAGIKSPSLFKEVASGKRNLTTQTISSFILGLGLNEGDGRFFENLVLFNQATSEKAKQRFLAILRGLRYRKPQRNIPVHQFEYYEQWYNPVLRELAVVMQWNGDYSKLAKAVVPAIRTSEARASISLQLRLGFLRQANDGSFVQDSPDITTGAEVASLSVRKMNRAFAVLGQESIDRFSPSERDVSSIVMGLSKKKIPLLKQEIVEFRKRLIRLVDPDDPIDCVYGLVTEFFPLARIPGELEAGDDHA